MADLVTTGPLVSVIIPAYNAATFLPRTLESVLKQTYTNLEVLVIDDGSTDETCEIVQQFVQRDRRVCLLRQANAGVAAARNLGIQQAKGEFIAPIDADDLWYPDNIAAQVQCAIAGGEPVGVVYSWSVYIDETDQPLGGVRAFKIEGNVFLTLLCHNFLGNASASLIRRSYLDQSGLYDPELRAQQAQGCEDWDVYLRLAEHCEFRVVPQLLVGYRKLMKSMSRDYTAMAKSYRLVLQGIRSRHPELSERLFRLSLGNFYMYLAYECDRAGDRSNTRFWLRQALSADPFTPLLRPSLYRLLFKAWLAATPTLESAPQPQPVAPLKAYVPSHPTLKQQLTIQLMISIGLLFHWMLPFIAKFPFFHSKRDRYEWTAE